jgi:Uri superfamily endonuclease
MTGKAVLTRGSFCARADDAPSLPGAYILAIELAQPLTVALRGKPATILRPGRYLYCGSARGPGGLKARLGRHMRRGKSVRWHVDLLTEAGGVLGAWAFPGGAECELAGALSRLPAPIAGFGSSDCARCRAHLFGWPEAPLQWISGQGGPRLPETARERSELARGGLRSEPASQCFGAVVS